MEPGQDPISNWRARGWVLILVGLFLVLFMAAIAWSVGPLMLKPGIEIDGTTFTGTAEQGQIFLALFGLVGGFGALCLVNGLHMVATGRRSQAFTRITLLLFFLLLAAGMAVRRGLV
jgi:hypothetical protein